MASPAYEVMKNEDDTSQKTDATTSPANPNVQVAGSIPPVAYAGQGQPMMVPGQYPQPGAAGVQSPMVVGQQPGVPVQVMPRPPPVPGCPPGLEYLLQLDQVLIHQQIELAEVFLNIDFANKYIIKNSFGQQVFFAAEESDACHRICCGSARGFVFHITDNMGQEVMRVVREFKCCAGCCWCADNDHCSFFIAVESPPGSVIGYVKQTQSFMSPHFDVLNSERDCVLKIRGHWCRCQTVCCTDDIDFKILTNDLETQIGKVSKQWGGWVRESFTKADNFGAQFPVDLDVKTKATIVAATFLIDFMFFEHQKKNKQRY
ncbi:phospholipid scramblase 1-like [Diadema antillarum]|uniref:phospholipid scramblase 1-like n=1 Tax=Diadema antillarum TaxID=105358 RepID=UPI003A863A4A